jgi:hypothetical protein
MKMGNYRLVLSLFFFSALLALTGCPDVESVDGKVTGGGWVESASGGKLASFGFNADSCINDGNGLGRFNFHDKNAGVKMNGHITGAWECVEDGPGLGGLDCKYAGSSLNLDAPSYEFSLLYRSTNPKNPGTGLAEARVSVKDNGEGARAAKKNLDKDFFSIEVTGGPYAGYTLDGFVRGNIQAHACAEVE